MKHWVSERAPDPVSLTPFPDPVSQLMRDLIGGS